MSATAAPAQPPPTSDHDPRSSSSSNPLHKLSSLDSSKKYTLIFLVSVGTTLLVTGASGGRLLKRFKASAPSATPSPSAGASSTSSSSQKPARSSFATVAPVKSIALPRRGTLARVLRAIPSSSASTSPEPLPAQSIPPTQLFADPFSVTNGGARRQSLLRSWSSPTVDDRRRTTAYFLPNTFITNQSTLFASHMDREDKLHQDGTLDEPDAPQGEFNPALYAAQALGIATVLTFSVFGLGVWALMRWYDVDDLPSLALAISQTSSPKLTGPNRPTVPEWAQPSTPPPSPSSSSVSIEDELAPSEMSYWTSVKETLDREAEERRVQRIVDWAELQKKRERTRAKLEVERLV